MSDVHQDPTQLFEQVVEARKEPGTRKFVRIECNLHLGISGDYTHGDVGHSPAQSASEAKNFSRTVKMSSIPRRS